MITRRELERDEDRSLIEVQFVGVSGQVCSTTWELTGPNPCVFTSRERACAALADNRTAVATWPGRRATPGSS